MDPSLPFGRGSDRQPLMQPPAPGPTPPRERSEPVMLQESSAMKLLSRVVWWEGMYLGPHHFQVQSRYFEDSIQFATSSLWFASYGLAGVELDANALQNGTVSLLHARGILPDGLPFNMPECDDLPQPRVIADLIPPTRDSVIVLLGIPPLR